MAKQSLSSLLVDLRFDRADFVQGVKQSQQEISRFASGAAKAGKVLAGLFVFDQIAEGASRLASYVIDGTKALAEEEKSAARLSGALTQLGYDAAALAPVFEAQTAALEESTLVDDEVIRQLQQLMIQYGIAPKAIDGAVRAVLDYSAATGKDAVGATQQLLTAISSGKDEVAKMGISIEATGDKTTDLSLAAQDLADKFGGSAQKSAEGLAGQLGRLTKAQEDLSKAVAAFLVRTGVSGKVINALTEAAKGLAYALGEEHEATQASADRARKLAMETESLTKARELLATATESEKKTPGYYAATIKTLTAAVAASEARIAAIKAEQAEASKRVTDEKKAVDLEQSAEAARQEAEERRKRDEEAREKRLKKLAELQKKEAEEAQRAYEKLAKMAAEQMRIERDLGRSISSIVAGKGGQQRAQAGLSLTPVEQAQLDTAGFRDFDDALTRQTSALIEQARALAQAEALAEEGNLAAAEDARDLADVFEALAEEAGTAVEAFKDIESAARSAQRAMVDKAVPGQLGSLISAGAQGAEAGAMGGPEGAAIGATVGVLLEMLTQSEQFQQLGEILNSILADLIDVVGSLIEPILPIVELLGQLVHIISTLLAPVFKALEPALRLMHELLKPIILGIGLLVRGIAWVWNTVSEAIADFLENFGAKDFAKWIRGTQFDLEDMDAQLRAVASNSYDAADATGDLADAAERATEAILNAPSGFNLNLQRQLVGAGTSGTGGGGGGDAGGGGGPVTIVINASGVSAEMVAQMVTDRVERRRYGRYGVTVRDGGY